MTLNELKAEAEMLGYKLVKNEPYVKLLPCTCGAKRSVKCYHYYAKDDFGKLISRKAYRCIKCGLEGNEAKSLRNARLEWNKAVKGETE